MKNILWIIPLMLLIVACKEEISREQAISITQKFVDGQVKFYVNEDNGTPIVQKASIAVLNTEKVKGVWNVFMHIQSNQTGELKQSDVVVKLDAKTGNVLNMQKFER
ncbi:hypothetical protein GOV09_03305 [Candidatus Woesearchaeota archaeon]|nr:hypothetical protein [Candidatus Woesearchaeota archaeon]